jgi:hypothetical protein
VPRVNPWRSLTVHRNGVPVTLRAPGASVLEIFPMPRRLSLLLLLGALLGSAQGCTTYQVMPQPGIAMPPPGAPAAAAVAPAGVSVGELLQMLKAGRPQAEIAADTQSRGLRAALAPADIDVLTAAGAGPELLQALRSAPAQSGALVANGGVPQGVVVREPPLVVYTQPWVWGPPYPPRAYWYGPSWGFTWGGPGWYRPHPFYHHHHRYRR